MFTLFLGYRPLCTMFKFRDAQSEAKRFAAATGKIISIAHIKRPAPRSSQPGVVTPSVERRAASGVRRGKKPAQRKLPLGETHA